MRTSRTMIWVCTAAVVAGANVGCQPRRGGGGDSAPGAMKIVRPPRRPPAVPPRRDVVVPEELRGAARAELRAAVEATDPVLRAHAVEGVKQAIQGGRWAASESFDPRRLVLAALGDRKPVVRMAAAFAAGELKLDAAREGVTDLANDDDPLVQVAARFALHRLGDTRLSRDLERSAQSSRPGVRGATATALGLLGEPSALNVLRPMLGDRDHGARLQVAEAMWRLGDREGLASLVTATVSAYPDDRMIALLALAQPRDTRVAEHVRSSLTADYPEVALVAARAMGLLGSDEGYGVAAAASRSVDPRQRVLAALALGAIGRPDAADLLAPLLKDGDPDVRIAAATAVLQLQ